MIINQKDDILIRTLEDKDDILLLKWLSNYEVLEYYEGRDKLFDIKTIHEKFYNNKADITRCIVEYCSTAIGYLQFYKINNDDIAYLNDTIYGTDQFIGEPSLWNKGIGTNLIKTVIEYLINEKKVSKIFLDPQCKNLRAIACYEKCGFKKIKLLQKNELHEGKFEDCWLMEYTVKLYVEK